LNTNITFRAESGRILRGKDYLRFIASGVLGVVTTTTTLVVLSNVMPVIAAKLASILAGFAVNFTMSHFVVFRPKASGETRL
jgi:putative flippase GtrA